MNLIVRFLKAVFNFFVGDWIILGVVTLVFLVLGLLNLAHLSGFENWGGYLLFAGMVLALFLTLYREARSSKRPH